MAPPEAFLVDVYETILTADFARRRHELAAMAGVPGPAWNVALDRLAPALNVGRLALAEAFEQIIRANGNDPRPDLVQELVRKERDLLLSSARVYDDALPFLEMLRSRGILIAIVSNCTENTRPLLSQRGISALADALVLSCEVGYAKPAPQVYRYALDQLGVAAGAAVFVDDQSAFCAAAVALGISAVQIVRDGAGGHPPVVGEPVVGEPVAGEPGAGVTVVRSLAQVEAMF